MDKTLIEFKLASNSKLKSNLQHQLSIYAKANDTDKYISVILYFTDKEEELSFLLEYGSMLSESGTIKINCTYFT